jgi:hypothetical protein
VDRIRRLKPSGQETTPHEWGLTGHLVAPFMGRCFVAQGFSLGLAERSETNRTEACHFGLPVADVYSREESANQEDT